MPARIGGDEFAVLLPNCDLGTAELVASKIVSALRTRAVETGEGQIPIQASAGVALLGQPEVSTGTDLLTAADRAMYRAKRGRSSLGIHDGPVVDPPSA
jgi:diguanylate cyclase (GGDEF)-like protein